MDSAGYTQETISLWSSQLKWISRVPETLSACQLLITSTEDLQPLLAAYSYRRLYTEQAGIQQRWLLIFSQQAYQQEMQTLKKTYQKQSLQEYKSFLKLSKQAFACEQDASKALEALARQCRYLQLTALPCDKRPHYASKGRPGLNQQADAYTYYIRAQVCTDWQAYQQAAISKGRFIIATNELDEQALPDVEVLLAYKGQTKVERGFRFLKDPQFVASTLFVKKPERIEALRFIMTLCLTVYAALEYKLQQQLAQQVETLPNQLGKPVSNPTMRWVFT